MDLLRTAINAFFYSVPIDMIGQKVASKYNADYISTEDEEIVELLKWESFSHTKSEMQLLIEAINNNWCRSDELGIAPQSYSLLERFPLLLCEFSKKVLIVHGNKYPIVKFNDLLRWRCMSLNIGEDMLITSLLALKDLKAGFQDRSMLWPTVLNHDNIRINAILEEELSDTHAHINASTDVFEFNWLRLMNHPGMLMPKKKREKESFARTCWENGERKSYDYVNRHRSPISMNHSLIEWSIVAAAIRIMMFCRLHHQPCTITRRQIVDTYYAKIFNFDYLSDFNATIALLDEGSLKTSNSIIMDYAIRENEFISDIPDSPQMVNHGERKFLYDWFYAYFGNRDGFRENADLMLLYLVIKGKIRREFIQTNKLIGFDNFQDFDSVKFQFIPPKYKDKAFWNSYRENIYRYAVQTALCSGHNMHLEARITPWEIDNFVRWDYRTSIFGKKTLINRKDFHPITLVVHFIKLKDSKSTSGLEIRHYDTHLMLRESTEKLISATSDAVDKHPSIVGIDAAGSELNCRPETFAPYYRLLRCKNISNFTFHAGEDFYDLVDGIRTIDETIKFMDYRFGDRIGHGLALGIDVIEYYNDRHYDIIIPAQILLDNLIWLKYTAINHNITLNASTLYFIKEQYRKLIVELGYSKYSQDSYDYFLSMSLRGDLCSLRKDDYLDEISEEIKFSPVSCGDDCSPEVKNLYHHYMYSIDARIKGNRVVTLKLPETFAKDVFNIQECMLNSLEQRGIVIETNPSSNIKIGRFARYDQHPITRFHSIDSASPQHTMMVSINTDDKGIFGTSLKNEYSLIALSLRKTRDESGNHKWNDAQIENYIRKIAHYGNISRFKDVN